MNLLCLPSRCNIFPLDAFDFPFSKLVLWKPMVKEMLAYTKLHVSREEEEEEAIVFCIGL